MEFEPIEKLTKDLKEAARTMTSEEARFAVDLYYAVQDFRIRNSNMISAIERAETDEPHAFLSYLMKQAKIYENQAKNGLAAYAKNLPEWDWLESVSGIGPVISAGLSAHIDIEKAPTVGHIWRFAGLDPTVKWEKGKKRPWNASLKTLCWKVGESFVKVSGKEDAFYGKIYTERKLWEADRNEQLLYKEQADVGLARVGKTTDAHKSYVKGKLPPGHLHARAKRYAVKLFLAHYHEVLYKNKYNKAPPKPYVIEHLGHVHKIPVPHKVA